MWIIQTFSHPSVFLVQFRKSSPQKLLTRKVAPSLPHQLSFSNYEFLIHVPHDSRKKHSIRCKLANLPINLREIWFPNFHNALLKTITIHHQKKSTEIIKIKIRCCNIYRKFQIMWCRINWILYFIIFIYRVFQKWFAVKCINDIIFHVQLWWFLYLPCEISSFYFSWLILCLN